MFSKAGAIGLAQATILFSDIRNFTTLAETPAPEDMVDMMNDYFTAMETAIENENGTINALIGDANYFSVIPPKARDAPSA